MLKVGGEVDFFFLELLFEILEEKLPDEFGFRDPWTILCLDHVNIVSPSMNDGREVEEFWVFVSQF